MSYPVCLCGSNKYRRYEYRAADAKFSVLACRACGLARTWPSPLENQAADDFYNKQSGHEEKFNQLALRRKFSLVPLNVLMEYCSNGTLLDVGSSVGIFVQVAREHGFDAQGIDLGEQAIRDGQEQLQLQGFLSVGTLEGKRFPSDYFNAISYLHCFEHIPDLVAELAEIKRVLKSDGFLIIEVPRFFSLWRLLLGSRWYGFCPTQHVWQFGKRGISNLLSRADFKIVSVRTRLNLAHDFSGLTGLIKRGIALVAWLTATGDNLIVVARAR